MKPQWSHCRRRLFAGETAKGKSLPHPDDLMQLTKAEIEMEKVQSASVCHLTR
jgi:hypothetical protein